MNYRFKESLELEKKKNLKIPSSISLSIFYLFTVGKNRLKGRKITFLRSHRELTPTITLFGQHNPRTVFEAERQSREEQGPKSNLSLCPEGPVGYMSRTNCCWSNSSLCGYKG